MVVYLAGLQAIPESFLEAARIDGAGGFQRFRRIILPLLAPTTAFLLIYNSIQAFQVFDQVFVLTSGGPAGSTNVIVLDLYRQAFERYNFGYASAEATVLFVLTLGVTVLQYVYSKRFEVELLSRVGVRRSRPRDARAAGDRGRRRGAHDSAVLLDARHGAEPGDRRHGVPAEVAAEPRDVRALPVRAPEGAVALYYWNSLVVAVVSVGCSLLFGLFAGYAFAVYRFPLQNLLFLLILSTLMVPVQVTSVALYVLLSRIGWVDTYAGILAPNFAAPSASSSFARPSGRSPTS